MSELLHQHWWLILLWGFAVWYILSDIATDLGKGIGLGLAKGFSSLPSTLTVNIRLKGEASDETAPKQ